MQEILDRRQKYLLELNAKQAEHAKLVEKINWQQYAVVRADNTVDYYIDRQSLCFAVTFVALGVPALSVAGLGGSLAYVTGNVVWGCVAVASGTWVAIGWKCLDKFYDWKYSAKINNSKMEYRQEVSRLNELKQQNNQLVGEINGLKANIKGCDEELRMMRCLTKVKSQKQELEMER